MKSISIRFALASVLVSLFILTLMSGINYIFLKKELILDATQKAHLIEENSSYKIEALLSRTQESSTELKNILKQSNFNVVTIKSRLTKILQTNKPFFGMTLAFNPAVMNQKPFSPYYYKKDHKILYRDLASKDYNYLTKDWYTIPVKLKKPIWSEPYFDKGGGNTLMSTYSNPIFYKQKVAAILTIDLSLQEIQDMVSSIKVLNSGYAFLLSKDHKILAYPDASMVMKIYPKKSFKYNVMIRQKHNWIYYAHIGNTGFTLAIVFPIDELFASLHYMSIISTVLALVGSMLLIITMILISRRISKPLRELTTVTDEISKGNFNKKINLPKSKDEVFRLSFAINTMQDALRKYIEDLKSATIKQQKIESELNIARSIQMSMLPKELPKNKNISIHALLNPAKAVGGDFYDFFYIDDEHLCFVIADVSGKGVPAAMFMAVTISYIRAYASKNLRPSAIVKKVNNALCANNEENMFVTMFLSIVNLKSHEMLYVNAGHTMPYIFSSSKQATKIETKNDPIIGAMPNLEFTDFKLKLEKNELLFLYTDGVNEAFSTKDEQFGNERIEKILNKNLNSNPEQILKNMELSIYTFTKGAEQSDDITMLLIG